MTTKAAGAPRRRSAWSRFRDELRQPLFRNGHALVLSSFATATIGFAYWVLAARGYDPITVGRSSVALTTMSFVGGIAQCNLASALVRFIPGAGRTLRRFVLASYGFSIVVSVLLAGVFFVALPTIAPSLEFLRHDRTIEIWFVISTAAQAIFVLEDGVLTGLRRATLVPIENAGFSLLKAVLVVAIAGLRPETGIFYSWTIATIATIVPTNLYIFLRAIPTHQKARPDGHVSLRDLVRYVPSDYGAWMFWAGATTLLPLVVIAGAGAAAAATFNFAWVITYSLYLVSINLGSSLVVESAADQSDLAAQCRQVMAHLAKLLLPASALVALGAPLIMGIFGHRYAVTGALTLRLLAISAPPFILTSTLQSALRSLRRTTAVLAIDATLCTTGIVLSWALLPHVGILATGIAWCVAQYGVAGVLGAILFARRRARHAGRPVPFSVLAAGLAPRLDAGLLTPALAGEAAAAPLEGRLERRSTELLEELRPDVLAELWRIWPVAGAAEEPVLEAIPATSSSWACSGVVRSHGWPAALVQVAGNDHEARALRRREAVLEVLSNDERLGDWRELLARTATGSRGVRVFSVELLSGGLDAATLLDGAPVLWRAVARRGLETLERLHGATAEPPGAEPLDAVARGTCERVRRRVTAGSSRPAGVLARIEGLERRLSAAARAHSEEPRAFVHGNLAPGLLRLTPEAGLVTGVRGFEHARPDGLPALDSLGFVLRVTALVRRRPLADLVAELCSGGELAGELSGILAPVLERSRLGLEDLALWCWAEELAGAPSFRGEAGEGAGYLLDPVLASLERAS